MTVTLPLTRSRAVRLAEALAWQAAALEATPDSIDNRLLRQIAVFLPPPVGTYAGLAEVLHTPTDRPDDIHLLPLDVARRMHGILSLGLWREPCGCGDPWCWQALWRGALADRIDGERQALEADILAVAPDARLFRAEP